MEGQQKSTETREAPPSARRAERTRSLRLIVTIAVSSLVLLVTIATGSLIIRHEKRTLEDELRRRLLAQCRNVASLASKPLLDDFPEFTLHPLVKGLQKENEDWSYVVVVDRSGLVKGAEEMTSVDAPFVEPASLAPFSGPLPLKPDEVFEENANLYQVSSPVLFQDGSLLGRVHIGMPKSHVRAVVAGAVKTTAGVTGVVLVIGLVLSTLIASSVVRPVRALTRGAQEIGRGNLAHRIETASRTELGALARTFNEMTARLEVAQRELVEKERIRRELEIAHELEEKLLPAVEARIPGWELAAFHSSAEEVGGDYYDIVPLGGPRYGIAIGDVAGKGIPGLVVMAMAGALLRSHAAAFDSPARLLARLNDLVHPSVKRGMFITLFYGILDAEEGTLVFANAGHNPLLYSSSADSVCIPVKTTGMPIGLVKGARFASKLADQSLRLAAGDLLLQYTDGVSEATDASENEYGVERLVGVVSSASGVGAADVVARLSADVASFAGGAKQSDDITILALRRLESAEEERDAVVVAHGGNQAHRESEEVA
jgi:serine phosphatase RsbU (regulator of sigma subunit)